MTRIFRCAKCKKPITATMTIIACDVTPISSKLKYYHKECSPLREAEEGETRK